MSNEPVKEKFRGQFRQLIYYAKRNPCVWPVLVLCVVSPTMAAFCVYKNFTQPDNTRMLHYDPERHDKFEHKKFRVYELTPFDYENYQHPRPRF